MSATFPVLDHSAIIVTDAVSAAAHDFLYNLAMYDDDFIQACLDDGLHVELAWWMNHNVENEDFDGVKFAHANLEPDVIATRIYTHIAGWSAADIGDYCTVDTSGEDDVDTECFIDFPEAAVPA